MRVSGADRPETFSCPACGYPHSIVKNTRPCLIVTKSRRYSGIARERECSRCRHRYRTEETIRQTRVRNIKMLSREK